MAPPADPAPGEGPGVLFIDYDSGKGGASRSLLFLATALRARGWRPAVVLSPANPLADRHRAAGIPVLALPGLPTFRPAQRNSSVLFGRFLWRMRHWPRAMRAIGGFAREHGASLVHANHENVALTGSLVARRLGLPLICHVRTLLYPSPWARWILRLIRRRAVHSFMIAEPVLHHVESLVGSFPADAASIVYNLPPPAEGPVPPYPEMMEPAGALRLLSLGNFSPNRGIDRMIDIAAALRSLGREDFHFFLCGQAAHHSLSDPSRAHPYYDGLVRRVREEGLEEMVSFPGHVPAPERALAACHALVRFTRVMPSPWGRDVIEAMIAGRPVVTLGEYEGFVRDGVNGFVDRAFDPRRVALHLIRLKDEPDLLQRMSQAAATRAGELFAPDVLVERILDGYRLALRPAAR